jgi:hypothetical protein
MRIALGLVLATTCLAAEAGSAQAAADGRWQVGILVDGTYFRASLVDTAAAPGAAARLRPTGRVGLGVVLGRSHRNWRVDLEAAWAGGRVEAGNSSVAITDRTSRLTRWRLAGAVGRRLAGLGTGQIGAAAGPTFDWWEVEGHSRLRAGAEARVTLTMPLGVVELENRMAIGLSGSPFRSDDAGPEFRRSGQVSVGAGAVLRLR